MSTSKPFSAISSVELKCIRMEGPPPPNASSFFLRVKHRGKNVSESKWDAQEKAWKFKLRIRRRSSHPLFVELHKKRAMMSPCLGGTLVAEGELDLPLFEEAALANKDRITFPIYYLAEGITDRELKLVFEFDASMTSASRHGQDATVNEEDGSQPTLFATPPPEPNGVMDSMAIRVDLVTSSVNPIGKILEGITPITELLDRLSEAIQVQYHTDAEIVDLYKTMVGTYASATRDEALRHHGALSPVFDAMVQQSVDCCLFIANYCSGGYLSQLIGNTRTSNKIDQFKNAFNALERCFEDEELRKAMVDAQDVRQLVVALRPSVDDNALESTLQMLKEPMLPPREVCLPGTRRHTLSTIIDWVARGKESVLWLSGAAGCGKTSLAATLKNCAIDMGCTSRIGGFIRFDRFEARDPKKFVKMLAHQLASFDSRLGKIIAEALRANPQILQHAQLIEQLCVLVLDPLQKCMVMQDEGPIVVVVDGLDDCMEKLDGSDGFMQMLHLFSSPKTFSSYPFLRLVLLSRPESCIRHEFHAQRHIYHIRLDAQCRDTHGDILSYLTTNFDKLFDAYPDFRKACEERGAVAQILASRAHGSFLWATTLLRFLSGPSREERLDAILSETKPGNVVPALYHTILDFIAANENDGNDARLLIRAVFGTIIAHESLNRLGDMSLTPTILHSVLTRAGYKLEHLGGTLALLGRLESLLPGDMGPHSKLSIHHRCLDDFFGDRESSGDWFIDVDVWKQLLTDFCISNARSTFDISPEVLGISIPYEVFCYAHYYWLVYGACCVLLLVPASSTFEEEFTGILKEVFEKYLLQKMVIVYTHFQCAAHRVRMFHRQEHFGLFVMSKNVLSRSDPEMDALVQDVQKLIVCLLQYALDFEEGEVDSSLSASSDSVTSSSFSAPELKRDASHIPLNQVLRIAFLWLCSFTFGPPSPLFQYWIPIFIQWNDDCDDFAELLERIENMTEEECSRRPLTLREGVEPPAAHISGIPPQTDSVWDVVR